jgi:hypothetical protein
MDTITLSKGTRLYYVSGSKDTLQEKSILSLTLHPSDWYTEDSFVSVIELRRDVSLLFMIKNIYKTRLYSSNYLPKINTSFDGWFLSFRYYSILFTIRNDPSILKIVSCLPLTYDWTNSIPKQWGNTYKLFSELFPVKLELNIKYKSILETYQKEMTEDPFGTTFSILLKNANIIYKE